MEILSICTVSRKLESKVANISDLDRKLLKILLQPNGDLESSKTLSAKLGMPITTVRRRRKAVRKHTFEIALRTGYREIWMETC